MPWGIIDRGLEQCSKGMLSRNQRLDVVGQSVGVVEQHGKVEHHYHVLRLHFGEIFTSLGVPERWM